MNRKVKSIKTMCGVKGYKCSWSFGLDTGPQSFCYSFIALSIILVRCSKSAQKFDVRMNQVVLLLWKLCSWF